MLHTNFQGSTQYGFRQEDFFYLFPIHVLAYLKQVTPGARPFWPQGSNLNNFGSGLLGDATYQLSKL